MFPGSTWFFMNNMGFAQIRGQEKAIGFLKRMITHGRMSHAYLFYGPDGVGKKTTAEVLAQTVNCLRQEEDKLTAEACLECSACRRIKKQIHPDVKLYEPDGNFVKIEAIRTMQHEISYKPFEGRYKVFIIDQADKMTTAAANCLLKTLEEPPAHSLIILISAGIHNLLPTVVSRCQRLEFSPLPASIIEDVLAESCGLASADAHSLAFFAEGSLSAAYSFDQKVLLKEREAVLANLEKLGRSKEAFLTWAASLAKDKDKTKLERHLKWLLLWFRDLLLWQYGVTGKELAYQDQRERLAGGAGLYSIAELQEKISAIYQSHEAIIRRNANPRLALDVLFMQLMPGRQSGAGMK